jgi:tol-pal system protein YbgF
MLKKSVLVLALMMGAACVPARADDVSNRVDALEQQVRELVGQIEELNYALKKLQGQQTIAPQQSGEIQAPVVAPPKKKLVMDAAVQPKISGQILDGGVEAIQENAPADGAPQDGTLYGDGDGTTVKPLGTPNTKSAQTGDGGFDGKVLVPQGEAAIGEAQAPQDGAAVEQVNLQPETPDDLFMRSEKALLQLQYQDAEAGFKDFLVKYPDHNLAGSAQFKLGETFYAQQDYANAAQNYLTGYKQFPKSRRAADSLLKLGLSLNKLGQKDQACAALGSVGTEFPKAVEANKRAQAEFKRAGCS